MNTNTEPKIISHRGVSLWVQVVIWALLIGLLVLIGLGMSRVHQGTIQPGDKVPDFGLTLFSDYEYNGQAEVKISDLRGKVVFINFWASWCKPCEQEALVLEEAWKYYQSSGKVVFLGVDYVDTEPEARIFLKNSAIPIPTVPTWERASRRCSASKACLRLISLIQMVSSNMSKLDRFSV